MHLILIIFGLITLIATAITVVALAGAPVGYEDATGFHLGALSDSNRGRRVRVRRTPRARLPRGRSPARAGDGGFRRGSQPTLQEAHVV